MEEWQAKKHFEEGFPPDHPFGDPRTFSPEVWLGRLPAIPPTQQHGHMSEHLLDRSTRRLFERPPDIQPNRPSDRPVALLLIKNKNSVQKEIVLQRFPTPAWDGMYQRANGLLNENLGRGQRSRLPFVRHKTCSVASEHVSEPQNGHTTCVALI